jgi:hypothetical protein
MAHLALAGNLLSAIGGAPDLFASDFVPDYPRQGLPGGIKPDLTIDLGPLDSSQLKVFMGIEHPHFPPVAKALADAPATIGDFYNTIIAGFADLQPQIDTVAPVIPVFGLPPISDVPSAIAVLERIKGEGEGIEDDPHEPTSHDGRLAHYYAFAELFKRRRLIKTNGKWDFDGDPITLPDVSTFSPAPEHPDNRRFREAFTRLLNALQLCWIDGEAFDLAAMLELKIAGTELIHAGIRPDFRVISPDGDARAAGSSSHPR